MIFPMPDRRRPRGPHPQDGELFAPAALAALRQAAADLAWLLGRGYAQPSALKLVGDRHELTTRQRIAVQRCSCSDEAQAGRLERQIGTSRLAGREIAIDGYNLLVTIESALAGGLILVGRDGACRDLASMHGSYRSMRETRGALELIGRTLVDLGVLDAAWVLDAPVSNSGRLRARMLDLAAVNEWHWTVELLPNPDRMLMDQPNIVVTGDSVILDGCAHWTNLARHIIQTHVPQAWVVDLG
jgi:hypothetical protein